MKQPAIFDDVELALTGYLRTVLPDYYTPTVRVSNAYRGAGHEVVVRRDGGNRRDGVEFPRIGVNVYGAADSGEQPVSDLARIVAALLCAADTGSIRRVRQTSGPSPIPDSIPRRYMTFELMLRPSNLQEIP